MGLAWALVWIAFCTVCWGQDVRSYVKEGNQQYQAGQYSEALNAYEQAVTEDPRAYAARFNQANAYYKLDDLDQAVTAYREVAAESKDMTLVAKAKYNLGNTTFQQGLKQQDSDLNKALEAMKAGIVQWRSVLELEPENPKAARNIEVARLKIKDLLDQIKKQQEQKDPNQPQQQDPNQPQQQQQQQNQDQQQKQQQQAGQDPNQGKDPNQPKEQPKPEPQPEEAQQQPQQDMTAQAILDKEQRQKEQRQQYQRVQQRPVDKDW